MDCELLVTGVLASGGGVYAATRATRQVYHSGGGDVTLRTNPRQGEATSFSKRIMGMNSRSRRYAGRGAGLARIFALLLCLGALLINQHVASAGPVEANGAAQDESGFYDDEFYDDDYSDGEIIADPLEPVNRVIFGFNDKLYIYVLKPTARAYRVLPQDMRVSIANFFSNLGAPIRMVNALFQFKLLDAGGELLRFGVNTTVGVGGLFDPAHRYLGLRAKDEDFGQTLGNYGAGPGFYLVLPVLGPSSARDGVGNFIDGYYFDPVVIVPDETAEVVALKALDTVNFLSLDKDTYESIKRESLDPYTFIKNTYAQNRAGKIAK
jgi:phospholipid-binding lipoprotein MlaA